jgi:hypothetical protein
MNSTRKAVWVEPTGPGDCLGDIPKEMDSAKYHKILQSQSIGHCASVEENQHALIPLPVKLNRTLRLMTCAPSYSFPERRE